MKRLFLILFFAFSGIISHAQNNVGIGTITPDSSAALDVSSTTQGLLVPRMTTQQRLDINNPANGLMVYDSLIGSFWFYEDAWTEVGNKPIAGDGVSITNDTITAKTYVIGDTVFGGIVFWVDDTKQHGLVAAFNGFTGVPHSDGVNYWAMAFGDGIYAGKMNTTLIIAAHAAAQVPLTKRYAAIECSEYTYTMNGIEYGDWYLPSRVEAELLVGQIAVINAIITNSGGDLINTGTGKILRTSTELNQNSFSVWGIVLKNGITAQFTFSSGFDARPIRAF